MEETPKIELTADQVMMAKKLTTLQLKLVLFLVGGDMSQRQAYLLAGGKAKSENTQDASASEILANPKVKAFHTSLIQTAATNAVMTKNEALLRLTKQARIKITDVCDFKNVEVDLADGGKAIQTVWSVKNAEDIDPNIAACIKSVTVTKEGPKIELYDANQTIKIMSDILGWNAPKGVSLSDPDGNSPFAGLGEALESMTKAVMIAAPPKTNDSDE